jgi:hypothetical protein
VNDLTVFVSVSVAFEVNGCAADRARVKILKGHQETTGGIVSGKPCLYKQIRTLAHYRVFVGMRCGSRTPTWEFPN